MWERDEVEKKKRGELRERDGAREMSKSGVQSSSSFLLLLLSHTIVGTKPTLFPARRCLRDQVRISAAVVMISGVEGVEVDIFFFAFVFFLRSK